MKGIFKFKGGIGQFLFLGFGVMLGVLAVQGGEAVRGFWGVEASSQRVIRDVSGLAENVREINAAAQESAADTGKLAESVKQDLVFQMREGADQLLLLQRAVDRIVESTGNISEQLGEVLDNNELDEDTAMIVEQLVFDSDDNYDQIKKECVPILRSAVGGLNTAVAQADLSAEQIESVRETIEGFAELSLTADQRAQDTLGIAQGSLDDTQKALSRIYLVLAIGLAVGLIVPCLIHRRVTRPIHELIDRVTDIAEGEGDLTQRVTVRRKDELGVLGGKFNTFLERIHQLIVSVAEAACDVASAATEIAASSEEMALGMNEQSGQVTQISAAIEQMSASVIEVARKSAEAADNAKESGKVASEGGQIVTETIDGMQAISEAVTASATSVSELGKRGEQIGQIIEVINDIADQTNLLALNAAIEAARAGEHGRGFAVVADEVRKLADRTTKATEEIGGSISAIQTETSQAVERMNAGTDQVQVGVEKATQAGQSLEQIVAGAQEVASMILSIAAAAEQQSTTSEEVSRNIQNVSNAASQVSEATSQASQATTQLSAKAEQLQALVRRFKV